MTSFEKFINKKPMSYKKIDLQRMPDAFNIIEESFDIPKIIHIVGTNGKGTTGRFIAEILLKNGFRVGHYTSPHILEINERFWKNGKYVSDDELEQAYKSLKSILPKKVRKALTYFEFTTLMNLPLFRHCDFLILEAGLGGEFDATNVFPKAISVFTPIGFDHQAFLGNSIEMIAETKLKSLNKLAVVSKQKYDEVLPILFNIAEMKSARIYQVQTEKDFGFLEENLATAKLTAKMVGAFNTNFQIDEFSSLFGRFQKVSQNVIVDVGHNPLSAERIVEKIETGTTLIYNSLDDKPFREILQIFKPKISTVEIIPIFDERALKIDELKKTLIELNIPFSNFSKISKKKKYLVFGSFKVVEEFLKTEK